MHAMSFSKRLSSRMRKMLWLDMRFSSSLRSTRDSEANPRSRPPSQSGAVTVGPYVRVNLIDCRDFTHTVTVGGQNYAKKGTACRETDGSWTVSPSVG